MRAIIERAREPSTWAGLSALAIVAGRADLAQAVQLLGATVPDLFAAFSAFAAIAMRERAK